MKKTLLAFLLYAFIVPCMAQTYNNEWISYTKPYYKFKVGANGIYRITQSALEAPGLNNTQAQHFQLWHNGEEVPLYTSVAAGLFTASDYIEFYGLMNDGTL